MRTCNHHPQWYNQPLRLTEEERQNPKMVVEDFFECYHLNDVREILWKWTVAIVSSPGNISSEPLERSNHIYFYEKMEALVEASFLLLNQINEQLNKTVVVTPGN
jgi:hypothetical protein